MNVSSSGVGEVQTGTIIAGRYEVVSRLGSGGMGVVFKAVDRDLNDDLVALKLLHPHLAQDETIFRRFRNEVLVARSLTHPNIVRTHDMGRAEGGFSYISMEYIDGTSLKDKIYPEQGPPVLLPFEEAVAILYCIIAGISYAHAKGVIHRDLKPANVLLSASGEVKLGDFGTARIVGMDTSITRTGQVLGTPDYMSPEQIRGEKLDASCDIYSLGIIAFELVSGTRPFEAESPVAVAFKHLNEKLPSLAGIRKDVPAWYENFYLKAAAKTRAERFASTAEMGKMLLDREPTLLRRPGIFPLEGTQFFTVSSGAIPVAENLEFALRRGEEQEVATAGNPTIASMPAAKGFELGRSGESDARNANSTTSSGGWILRAGGQLAAGAVSEAPSSPGQGAAAGAVSSGSVSKKMQALKIGFALACGVGAFFLSYKFGRVFGNKPQEIASGNFSPKAELLQQEGALPGFSNVPPHINPKGYEINQMQQDPRLALQQELAGLVEDGGNTAEQNAKEQGAEAKPQSNTAPAEKVLEQAPVEEQSKKVDLAANVAVKEQVVVPVPPANVVPQGSLELLRAGQALSASEPVGIAQLANLTWGGALTGIDWSAKPEAAWRKEVVDALSLKVIEGRSGKVLTRIKATNLDLLEGASAAKVKGTLSPLARLNPSVGQYRLELAYNDEVIATSSLSLYKAGVTVLGGAKGSAAGNSSGVGGNIAIIRGADVVGPPANQESEAAVAGLEKREPSAQLPPGQLPAVVDSQREVQGLPPAKGRIIGELPRVVAPPEVVAPQEQPEQIAEPVAVVRESFGGNMVGSAAGAGAGAGAQEQNRSLILELEFVADNITGSATIAGMPQFSVSGRVLARGIELELRNSSYSLRLSGSRRDRAMRGRYTLPALNEKGAWEVVRQ